MEDQARRGAVAPGILIGAVIMAVGVLLLLGNLGIVEVRAVWNLWPLALVAAGIVKLVDARGPGVRMWGALLVLIGAVLTLDHLGYVRVPARVVWPVALILAGLTFLWRALERRDGWGGAVEASDTAVFSGCAIFGGGKRRVVAQDFRSGEVVAMFGGYEIDMTGAGMAGPKAVIDVNAMFGGVEIRVPPTWNVTLDGIAILGGYDDKTRPAPDPATAKNLVIKGLALFGGVEVKN